MSDEPQQATSADDLAELSGLKLKAPDTVFVRFRRRAGLIQGGRLLVDSQVIGFWLVLDTLLKLLFKVAPLGTGGTGTQHTDVDQSRTGDKA